MTSHRYLDGTCTDGIVGTSEAPRKSITYKLYSQSHWSSVLSSQSHARPHTGTEEWQCEWHYTTLFLPSTFLSYHFPIISCSLSICSHSSTYFHISRWRMLMCIHADFHIMLCPLIVFSFHPSPPSLPTISLPPLSPVPCVPMGDCRLYTERTGPHQPSHVQRPVQGEGHALLCRREDSVLSLGFNDCCQLSASAHCLSD